jgi:hypothetical protein
LTCREQTHARNRAFIGACFMQLLMLEPAIAADFDPFATEQLPEGQKLATPQKATDNKSAPLNTGSSAENPVSSDPNTSPMKLPEKNPQVQPSPAPLKTPQKSNAEKEKVTKKAAPVVMKPKAVPPPSTGPFKLDVGMENINTVNINKASFNTAEYTDDRFLLPFAELSTLLRSQLKLTSGRAFLISARPFFEVRHGQSFLKSGQRRPATEFTPELGESFATVNFSNRFGLTVGQENFQWGGSEFASPSNWIWRASELAETISRSPQAKVKTRQTARLNFSVGQSFTLVTIGEYEPQKRALPSTYEGRRFLLKPEFSWNAGSDFFGIVVGGAERQRFPFIGEYFSLGIGDSLSVYLDAGHMKGSDILVPEEIVVQDNGIKVSAPLFQQSRLASDNIYHELLLGLKYTFDMGAEFKLEAYSNSSGYSQAELRLVEQMYKTDSVFFPLFFAPGVESRAQKGLFVSARQSNFGSKKNWTLLARYWKPILDSSGGGFLYAENGFNDNLILYLAAGGFHGPLVSESSLPQRFVISLGQKYVW